MTYRGCDVPQTIQFFARETELSLTVAEMGAEGLSKMVHEHEIAPRIVDH